MIVMWLPGPPLSLMDCWGVLFRGVMQNPVPWYPPDCVLCGILILFHPSFRLQVGKKSSPWRRVEPGSILTSWFTSFIFKIYCQLSQLTDSLRGRGSWNWWGQAGWAQWFSIRQFCPPGDTWTMSGDISGCLNLGEWVPLASCGQRPGMLLNFWQCTGQSHNKEWSIRKCQ